MSMTLYLLAGFAILTLGAEVLVRGSVALALRLGLTPLLIGLTIVAMGTSTPELAVSVKAALSENSGIALGNVVGSNIANIGLILGLAAMIRPVQVQLQMIKRDLPILVAISVLLWALVWDGGLSRVDGALLVLLLLGYIGFSYWESRQESRSEEEMELHQHGPAIAMALVVAGIAMLVGGGMLFVEGAVQLATSLGISQVVIGLTIVAVGTSMPELVTSVVAALRGHSDIAIGNVVGSNIFNILGILGVTALVYPVSAAGFNSLDFAVMLGFALVLLPFARTGLVVGRAEGLVLVVAYLGYLGWLVSQV